MGGAECSQGWQEEFLRVNYIKACVHADGNNGGEIDDGKDQPCNFRRMESSSNVVGKRIELESTDASGLVS